MGEPLRRVLEADSLGHLLALHWLTKVFGRRGGFVGAHPGVTFTNRAAEEETTIGEADVLLLFTDGTLVPVEVKRTAAGVDDRTFDLMDGLSNALQAPFDILAVSQPARRCPGLADSVPQPSGRPRLVVSDDQILDPSPSGL